jgi:hypothetical protein
MLLLSVLGFCYPNPNHMWNRFWKLHNWVTHAGRALAIVLDN